MREVQELEGDEQRDGHQVNAIHKLTNRKDFKQTNSEVTASYVLMFLMLYYTGYVISCARTVNRTELKKPLGWIRSTAYPLSYSFQINNLLMN